MIDFENKEYFKLKQNDKYAKHAEDLVVPGEEIIDCFSAGRDGLVFTTGRIIIINIQGVTGKKTDFTSIPYSKINMYSVETAGHFDRDAELDIVVSGIGLVRFEFKGRTNMPQISQYISRAIMK